MAVLPGRMSTSLGKNRQQSHVPRVLQRKTYPFSFCPPHSTRNAYKLSGHVLPLELFSAPPASAAFKSLMTCQKQTR